MKKIIAIILSTVILTNLTVSVAFAQEPTDLKTCQEVLNKEAKNENSDQSKKSADSESTSQNVLNKETTAKTADKSINSRGLLKKILISAGCICIGFALWVNVKVYFDFKKFFEDLDVREAQCNARCKKEICKCSDYLLKNHWYIVTQLRECGLLPYVVHKNPPIERDLKDIIRYNYPCISDFVNWEDQDD